MDRRDLLPPGPGWELTEGEKRLVECGASGEFWQPKLPPGGTRDPDPAKAAGWPDECKLRPEVLRCLAIGARWSEKIAPWPVHASGIQIRGARITGNLNLRGCEVLVPLWLQASAIEGAVVLADARTQGLTFEATHVRSLNATRAQIQGDLYLREKFHSSGEVTLNAVLLAGRLDCKNGTFENPGKIALNCNAFSVSGDVYFNSGFQAQGKVTLVRGEIGGQLNCNGGQFANKGDTALHANTLVVGADVHMRENFGAVGGVDFSYADISGAFQCRDCTFENAGKTALGLYSAKIASELDLAGIKSCVGTLDLRQAQTRTLHDGDSTWLASGSILLDGFTYERLSESATSASKRLQWLNRQHESHLGEDFRPQPWAQLIKVLHEMGHDEDVRLIAMQREAMIARRRRTPWYKKWLWYPFLWASVGYGYRPWRAFWISLALIAIGWVTFAGAFALGFMAPKDPSVAIYLAENPKASVPPLYTEFNSLVYAVDVYLPVIELGQDEAWAPSSVRAPNAPPLAPGFATAADFFAAGGHRAIYWLEEIAGWVFVSLYIAGMSGIMKKE